MARLCSTTEAFMCNKLENEKTKITIMKQLERRSVETKQGH